LKKKRKKGSIQKAVVATTLYDLVEFLLLVEARESASLVANKEIQENLKVERKLAKEVKDRSALLDKSSRLMKAKQSL